jgi:hypothetical protein
METQQEYRQRIEKKIEAAQWPDDVPVPVKPKLKLSGNDGNAFFILGRAKREADKKKWTAAQWSAFSTLAKAGDYDHLLQTCMDYFDVR